jgi:hypothetical protein
MSAWDISAPIGPFFMKLNIWRIFFLENLSRKFVFHINMARITGTLCADVCSFVIVSRWSFLRMRIITDKSCRKNQNTLLCLITLSENRAVYDNLERYGRAGQAA